MHEQQNPQELRPPQTVKAPSAAGFAGDARIRSERLHFGTALEILRAGGRVARTGWNGRNQFISLQLPDRGSKMSRPYLYISTVDGELVPWVASQTDLLAFDWCIVTEKTVLQYGDGRAESSRVESSRA